MTSPTSTTRARPRPRPREGAARTVTTAAGDTHTVTVDPPRASLIGGYRDGGERREVSVEPGAGGDWTVTDRPSGKEDGAVAVETIAGFSEDPVAEAVALAADYLQVAASDPDRRAR